MQSLTRMSMAGHSRGVNDLNVLILCCSKETENHSFSEMLCSYLLLSSPNRAGLAGATAVVGYLKYSPLKKGNN